MGKAAANIAARVAQLAGDAPAPEAPVVDSAPGASAGAPPTGSEASGAESTPGASSALGGAPSTETASDASQVEATQKTKHELLEEKLRETRERREAQRLSERARREKEAAESDRKAVADERAKFNDALRKGTIKETLEALGRDPREVFDQMAAEAREAGKPETQIARMKAEFDRQVSEVVEPLKKKIDELEEREKRAQAHAELQSFANDFERTIQRAEFQPLLVEYEPETLFDIVQTMKAEPKRLFAAAERLKVKLTASAGRFNMLDICNVLRAQHEDHERGREQRRARLQASTTSQGAPQQAPAKAPTVNGTAEKRNAAGNPLGNDLAASRATEAQKPRTTRRQRVERLISGG